MIISLLAVVISGCGNPFPPDLSSLEPGRRVSLLNNRDLFGWKVLSGDFYEEAGKVEFKNGILVVGAGDPMTGIGWKGEVPRNNYEINLTGRRVKGDDFFCGLTFPVGDGFATLILGGWHGSTVGISNINGFPANQNPATTYINFENGRWYEISLKVADGRITVTLDGRKIISQVIEGRIFDVWPQQTESRPLGIATYSTRGEFKKITFKKL